MFNTSQLFAEMSKSERVQNRIFKNVGLQQERRHTVSKIGGNAIKNSRCS